MGFRSMNNQPSSPVIGRPKSSHAKDLSTGVHVQVSDAFLAVQFEFSPCS